MSGKGIFVLVCTPYLSATAVEQERTMLSRLLSTPLMRERFYQATELVDRNQITSNRTKIKEELSKRPMRSCRFVFKKK
jgi:hypothetical protein